MSSGHELGAGKIRWMAWSKLVAIVATTTLIGGAFAGHDNVEVDPALKRYAGQVIALGDADAEGQIYSFQAKRLPAAPDYTPNELRGWRLTMLAGKRFAHAFEVQSNSGTQITVSPVDGPLNGIAASDVFVMENIAIERQK
jgi:hypothetical protein